jgi:hypothetical protein
MEIGGHGFLVTAQGRTLDSGATMVRPALQNGNPKNAFRQHFICIILRFTRCTGKVGYAITTPFAAMLRASMQDRQIRAAC